MKIAPPALIVALLIFLLSCTTTRRNVVYFPTLRDSVINQLIEDVEPPIVSNDIITISISGLDPEASALFNKAGQGSSGGSGSGSSGGGSSYLVGKDGLIQIPLIGQVKAAGLTKKELASNLSKQLISRKLLLDPIISIRQDNYRITVLGEVSSPGVYPVPNEQINILEAIGMAGDITLHGKKENVLLIRQEGGKKVSRRLDLASNSLLTSPYFNLRSNDIVYVEPSEEKIKTATPKQSLYPIILSTASFLFLLIDRIAN